MLLAKSCFSKDHVQNRKTIRIGSLQEYKLTESKQIVDREEGTLSLHFKFDEPITLKRSLYNDLFGPLVYIGGDVKKSPYAGKFNMEMHNLLIMHESHSQVTIKLDSAKIEQTWFNSFIFCMSRLRKMQDAIGIFPDYDDYWYLQEANMREFGNKVGGLLKKHVIREQIKGNFILPEHIDTSKLQLYIDHKEVAYISRQTHINQQNVEQLSSIAERMANTAFIKPPEPFEKEKEFRFIYTFVYEGSAVPPLKNSVILEIPELMPMLFW